MLAARLPVSNASVGNYRSRAAVIQTERPAEPDDFYAALDACNVFGCEGPVAAEGDRVSLVKLEVYKF